MFERGGVGPLKKCSFWCNGPTIKTPQIPLGHEKKSFWRYFYRIWRYSKMPHFLGGLNSCQNVNWRPQLHAQRSKMHSNLLGPSEKNSFSWNFKEYALCAILRVKKTVLGQTQRLKKVLPVVRCAENAPQRPKKMQIPRGYQKQMFIVQKICDFVGRVEIPCLRGVGWIPSKVLILVQRPHLKSTSDSVGAPKKLFWRYFYRIWRYSKMPHFWGAWISAKTWIGGLSYMHKRQKCIQTLWNHQKKIPFVENFKEYALCAILREKKPFWGTLRGWKRCCPWSGALKMLPRGPKKCKSLGAIRKNVYCVESLRFCW